VLLSLYGVLHVVSWCHAAVASGLGNCVLLQWQHHQLGTSIAPPTPSSAAFCDVHVEIERVAHCDQHSNLCSAILQRVAYFFNHKQPLSVTQPLPTWLQVVGYI
jgi:hypothetical protein